MIIDDSRNVLAQLKADLHNETTVKSSADLKVGDIVYLEMDENDGLTLRNGYATRRKYVVIPVSVASKRYRLNESDGFSKVLLLYTSSG